MQQIIAMGGGGFSMEPDNLALDRYVIAQTGKTRPSVCFLSQASGEARDYRKSAVKPPPLDVGIESSVYVLSSIALSLLLFRWTLHER